MPEICRFYGIVTRMSLWTMRRRAAILAFPELLNVAEGSQVFRRTLMALNAVCRSVWIQNGRQDPLTVTDGRQPASFQVTESLRFTAQWRGAR